MEYQSNTLTHTMIDSWWLKVKRAQKHMADIYRCSRIYADSDPYEFVRIRLPDSQGQVRHRIRITRQPDPMIAVMLGDFVHNLRSALDHIIVASVPRQERENAGFPIVSEDLWAKDETGSFVVKDNERRDNAERAIRGLDPRARALVIGAQPYTRGADAWRQIFGLMSRIENADKHRELAVIGGAVMYPKFTRSVGEVTVADTHPWKPGRFLADGNAVWIHVQAGVPPSEMNVQYSGTAVIHLEITKLGGNNPPSTMGLVNLMLGMIRNVRMFLRLTEPYIIR